MSKAGKTILVLGGARSGKSAFAESLIDASMLAKVYIATGQAFDREMSDRIEDHQSRRGSEWANIEEPFNLTEILRASAEPGSAVLVDCLTLWLTNLMLENKDWSALGDELVSALPDLPGLVVFVSSEVGQGIVPDNYLARSFRDQAGLLHQKIAAVADEVHFVTAGLPLKMKG